MKYLTTVTLENFQSHKYSVIKFEQGLNVIVGPSDTGKSAIIRAIKWALYNEPAGDYFIREGEKECSVSLEFNDGIRIKRLRSKSKNIYLLYDKNGNEMKFEGFGTTVPQEIIDAVGMKKIYLDSDATNAINLGEQLEGPFLLSEKTSTRASAIGRLIGVNIIDDALKETLKDLRNFNTNKKHMDDNISNLNKELKRYDYLEELSERVDKVDKITNVIKQKQSRLKTLEEKLLIYDNLQNELRHVEVYLEKFKNIKQADVILKDITYLNDRYKYFSKRKGTYIKNKIDIDKSLTILKQLGQVDEGIYLYDQLIIKYNRIQKLTDLKNKVLFNSEQLEKIYGVNEKIQNLDQIEYNINLMEKIIKRLLDFKNMNIKLKDNRKNINIGTAYTKKLQKVNDILDIYDKLQRELKLLYKYKDFKDKLDRLEDLFKKENQTLMNTKINLDDELVKYRKLLKKLEVCPLCLSNIDNEKIQHIIEHYN